MPRKTMQFNPAGIAETLPGHAIPVQTAGLKAKLTEYRSDGRIVAIGASTGGLDAAITILSAFPKNGPPTLFTQHLPAPFTRLFAERLNSICAMRVQEAVNNMPVERGNIYLAPGSLAHLEISGGLPTHCILREGPPVNGHRPSVETLFHSVALSAGARAIGVILTGMGTDGAKGLLAMRKAGAKTLGQDRHSSIVYGMPKAAFEIGAVELQLPLADIAEKILEWTNAIGRRQ